MGDGRFFFIERDGHQNIIYEKYDGLIRISGNTRFSHDNSNLCIRIELIFLGAQVSCTEDILGIYDGSTI